MSAVAPASACAACSVVPLAQDVASRSLIKGGIVLSLPSVHCAACIGAVERALLGVPGVRAARVNLSRKRVTIDAKDVGADHLINVLGDVGYEAQELDAQMLAATETDAEGRTLLMRLAVAGFAMMNVMLFSVAVWSGASEATRIMFHWISAGIAVPALLFSAQTFFGSAWRALRVGHLNMDVPISLAIILACIMSVYETTRGSEQVYFDAALSLTFFLLIGRYLDHRSRVAARSAARELTALELPRATRIIDGRRETVDLDAIAIGDQVAVAVGMRIPVDGVLLTGTTDVDRSFMTGESRAVPVAPGAMMSAGEVNLTGPIVLRVTAVGENTTLRQMAALVEVAEGTRNRYTALADRAAQIYAPGVHLLALLTFIGWWSLSGQFAYSLNIAISVLIITCPCALGLAVPAVMTAASGNLFRRGLLVKNATAIERLAEVDSVVFDKTGTLTTGHATFEIDGLGEDEICVLAGLTQASEHPVSRAIHAALPDTATAAALHSIVEHPGLGITAKWIDLTVSLGRGDWVGAETSPALRLGAAPAIPLPICETLRDGAYYAVSEFTKLEMKPLLLTGDSADAAATIAVELGGIPVLSGVSPAEKSDRIKDMSSAGERVLMVGDGLNDTVALAQAHASISPASALDASRAASDIVLLGQSLAPLPGAVQTAKSARKRVIENFGIAATYNMIAIPVAVLGYATPLGAAITMSVSSITVLLNALRLR